MMCQTLVETTSETKHMSGASTGIAGASESPLPGQTSVQEVIHSRELQIQQPETRE